MKKLAIILLVAFVNLFSQEPLSSNVLNEIRTLSDELMQKTGIKASVLISDNKSFQELMQNAKTQDNYATIILSLKDKKLAVVSDLDCDFRSVSEYYYLKYGFFPTQGAILPILTQPKGKDSVNAAVLNGFAQLCDIIAKDKNIKLENSFGDANDNFINIIRLIFYILIVVFIIIYIKKRKKKNER